MYKNLKITAKMQGGIIADNYLPLDSIVFFQICREHFGSQQTTSPNKEAKDLPYWKLGKVFEKRENDGKEYFACSFGIFENSKESQIFYTKQVDISKSDLIDFGNRTKRIQTASGRYKRYNITHYYTAVPEIIWYAKADKELLEQYLKFILFIGKKTSQGWGAVLEWVLEEIQEDYSCFKDGEPMRSIPDKNGNDYYGIKPSYWNAENQTKCLLPKGEKK